MPGPDLLSRLTAALTGRYTVQRELGHGGMATVFLAQDEKHHRPVALKVLSPELAAVLGGERFLREIEIAARLTHPHILPLHDSGNLDGLLYYVMPYVDGESLRDRLTREKQLPLDDALQISREVADALSYAHAHGVVHRDIKPENILFESGHAVVADFGIARAIDAAGGETLTQTGMALGTPAYMSPEQAAGSKDLDGRSDLYSLGCVLYEMLAGTPPFTGPTVESVVHQHMTAAAPDVTQIRAAVPLEIAAALSRTLAKTPADRFNTASQFSAAVAAVGSASITPVVVPAATRWGGRRFGVFGIAALVVIVGVFAALHWTGRSAHALRYPRTAIAVLPFRNLSSGGPYAYFAGGLHDELITQFAKVASLKVIGRASVAEYEHTTKPMKQIASELGVGSLVEASVQILGNRLRVNVELLDPGSGTDIWAQRYDSTLDDAFAVQSDIAQRIVEAVGATLGETEQRAIAEAPTKNAEAYRLYLQGEEYRLRPGYYRANLESAQQLYERALALDPDFALAHASLSIVHGSMYWFGYDPYPARAEKQRQEAEAAVRLAPAAAQAHYAMGMAYYQSQRDYQRALRELTIGVKELPGSAELWSSIGYTHRRLGNWDQALAAFERAAALDPRDVELFHDLGGNTYRMLHRYKEAVHAYSQALALAPDLADADLRRALVYVSWQGHLDSLQATLARGPDSYGYSGSAVQWRVRLALWERKPDVILALVAAQPAPVIFEAQEWYEPGLLYAGWAQQLRGDSAAARTAFRGALTQLDSLLRDLPNDYRLHAARGLALAGLGQRAAARQEADWLKASVEYRDAYRRSNLIIEARALIFTQTGTTEAALREIKELLSGPSWVSVYNLRLDPRWDPIRKDPRFQALLAKYTPPKPVE